MDGLRTANRIWRLSLLCWSSEPGPAGERLKGIIVYQLCEIDEGIYSAVHFISPTTFPALSASEQMIYENLNYFHPVAALFRLRLDHVEQESCAVAPNDSVVLEVKHLIPWPSTLELARENGTKISELVLTSGISFTSWSRTRTIPSNFTDAQEGCLVYLYRQEKRNLEITKHYSLNHNIHHKQETVLVSGWFSVHFC